jgi:preprotein translocase subunit SecA
MLSWLFGRRPGARREPDRVWISRRAKLEALLEEPDARIVAHFAESARALEALARERGRALDVRLADRLGTPPPSRNQQLRVVVAERHPLREHDERVAAWADAAAGSVVFHVSLEDPLLAAFASDSLKPLLERLGLTPDAPVEHGIVSRSIRRAQEQIRKRCTSDLPANSAESWMQANGLG